jgi:hypothetical protein
VVPVINDGAHAISKCFLELPLNDDLFVDGGQGMNNLPAAIRTTVIENKDTVTKLKGMPKTIRYHIRFVLDQTDCVDFHRHWLGSEKESGWSSMKARQYG